MKIIWMGISALICAVSATSIAQPPPPDAGIIGIAHIALRVSDLDREIAFLGKLGYEQAFAMTSGGKTTEVFIKVNDRQFIELYPRTDPAQPLGLMNVCYEAGDLNALQRYLSSEGLKPSPVLKASAGNIISSMKDPEGRVTEFIQYMPGSRHMLDRGMHLGLHRVSTDLLGFELPVDALAAERQFYVQLEFEAEDADGNVRLTTPGAPDLLIELKKAHPGSQPQFLFPVPDARNAAAELKDAGVRAERSSKLVFVYDPDGNAFVFLETGEPHGLKILPWNHKRN